MKEPRQKDRLDTDLISSCDKYGHCFGDDSERFPPRWPPNQTNAPLADRFGHICRSAELASTVTEKQERTVPVIDSGKQRRGSELPTNRALEQQMSRICQSECSGPRKTGIILGNNKGSDESDDNAKEHGN